MANIAKKGQTASSTASIEWSMLVELVHSVSPISWRYSKHSQMKTTFFEGGAAELP
jgi:hypothetical protein